MRRLPSLIHLNVNALNLIFKENLIGQLFQKICSKICTIKKIIKYVDLTLEITIIYCNFIFVHDLKILIVASTTIAAAFSALIHFSRANKAAVLWVS